MKTPPLLPGETLRRVLLVAKIDGIGVMAVAGLLTLWGLVQIWVLDRE